MSKGVSPIIATVLVLLIAITMGGAFLIFANQSFSDVSETADEQISQTSEDVLAGMKIESVASRNIYIRNTGGSNIENSTIAVFIDGNIISTGTISPSIITPDVIGTIPISSSALSTHGLCNNEHTLRVSTGSAEDSQRITISDETNCNMSEA